MAEQFEGGTGAVVKKALRASRPFIEDDYGIPKDDEGMLLWSDVEEWLSSAPVLWLATASPDGQPHATPIWGAYVDGAIYFDGSPKTRWARNLQANPRIVVHIEHDNNVVMLDGTVSVLESEPENFEAIADSYSARYPYRPERGTGMFCVRPYKIMAWNNESFAKSATRWHLADE